MDGIFRIFEATREDNLVSETTILGSYFIILLISSLICLGKLVNHSGMFEILYLTENHPSILQANSTGGTVIH